jgi:hypothetical protein
MAREWTADDTKYFLRILLKRHGKKCHYCGIETCLSSEIPKKAKSTAERRMMHAMEARRITIDHVIPISKGGKEFDVDNMVIACLKCNRQKGARFPKAFARNKKRRDV